MNLHVDNKPTMLGKIVDGAISVIKKTSNNGEKIMEVAKGCGIIFMGGYLVAHSSVLNDFSNWFYNGGFIATVEFLVGGSMMDNGLEKINDVFDGIYDDDVDVDDTIHDYGHLGL